MAVSITEREPLCLSAEPLRGSRCVSGSSCWQAERLAVNYADCHDSMILFNLVPVPRIVSDDWQEICSNLWLWCGMMLTARPC